LLVWTVALEMCAVVAGRAVWIGAVVGWDRAVEDKAVHWEAGWFAVVVVVLLSVAIAVAVASILVLSVAGGFEVDASVLRALGIVEAVVGVVTGLAAEGACWRTLRLVLLLLLLIIIVTISVIPLTVLRVIVVIILASLRALPRHVALLSTGITFYGHAICIFTMLLVGPAILLILVLVLAPAIVVRAAASSVLVARHSACVLLLPMLE
jgi:hypothetical protein